ncbi:hypothetical protein GR216_17800 [Rhizobium leguminosarum]|nr:hypothetical protein [Rhizobium ruizarguesonis]NEJ36852.1 hypothetical protein [Rhizobium ruizarguesonis]
MPEFNAHVVLGESLTPVGQLRVTQAGPRQFSTFAYDPATKKFRMFWQRGSKHWLKPTKRFRRQRPIAAGEHRSD